MNHRDSLGLYPVLGFVAPLLLSAPLAHGVVSLTHRTSRSRKFCLLTAVSQMDESSLATGLGMCCPQVAQSPWLEVLKIAHAVTAAHSRDTCCLLAARTLVPEVLKVARIATVLDLSAYFGARIATASDLSGCFGAVQQTPPQEENVAMDTVWSLIDSRQGNLETNLATEGSSCLTD